MNGLFDLQSIFDACDDLEKDSKKENKIELLKVLYYLLYITQINGDYSYDDISAKISKLQIGGNEYTFNEKVMQKMLENDFFGKEL